MKNRSDKGLIINYYVRLYNNFFRGVAGTKLYLDIVNNSFSLHLHENSIFLNVFRLLKYSTLGQLTCLVEVAANQTKGSFFTDVIVYYLLSLRFNYRFNITLFLHNQFEKARSLYKVFYNSVWLEREVWDLFGILFKDHPDLRRILTDYGFIGHPLQKDFPLVGFLDSIYSDVQKRVVYISVEFTQVPRIFSRKS